MRLSLTSQSTSSKKTLLLFVFRSVTLELLNSLSFFSSFFVAVCVCVCVWCVYVCACISLLSFVAEVAV